MRLYMIVSRDEYQLPIAVSESIADLARTMHMSIKSLSTMFSKGRNPKCKQMNICQCYITLDIDDDEDDDDLRQNGTALTNDMGT